MLIQLNHQNCKKYTGLSYRSVFQLSGIFDIHRNMSDFEAESSLTWDNGVLYIRIHSSFIKFFRLRIDFENGVRIIENQLLLVGVSNTRCGLRILCGQVNNSHEFGVKQIKILAQGDSSKSSKVNGFIKFGEYGFLMDQAYQQSFENLMQRHGRTEKYLHELLRTPDGYLLWEKHGESWMGTFDTSSDSLSMQILTEKLKKDKESKIAPYSYLRLFQQRI